MRAQVIRGGSWLSGQQAVGLLVHLALLVVLSRLLTPAEIGLAAMLAAVAGLAGLFAELGIGAALVQRANIAAIDIASGMAWVAGAGTLLAIALYVALPPLFDALGVGPVDPWLAGLTASRCLSGPLASFALSLRQRELDFRGMAVSVITGMLAGQMVVSIALALLGWGAAAIVAGQFAANALQFAIAVRCLRGRVLPRPSWTALRGLLGFAGNLTTARVAQVVHQYVDRPLLGALLSAPAVGHYVRADQLARALDLAVQPLLSSLGFPVLARLQDDPARLRAAFETGLAAALVFTVPAALALSVAAGAIVRVALGEGWDTTAAALAILAFVPVFVAAGEMAFAALRALGRLRAYALVQWAQVAATAAAIVVAAPWGLETVAWGMLAVRIAGAAAVIAIAAAAVGLPGPRLVARGLPWLIVVLAVRGGATQMAWPAHAAAALALAGALALALVALAALLPRIFLTPALVDLRDRAVAGTARA